MEDVRLEALFSEMSRLQERYKLHETAGPDYFEPGMMEYLDKTYGSFNDETGEILLRFEVKGTRYEGRTARIENVNAGDPVSVIRDAKNEYNSNNFEVLDRKGKSLGNLPASICDAVAPLYDDGAVEIVSSSVSFADPVSKRSRYAKQAVLFIEMVLRINAC